MRCPVALFVGLTALASLVAPAASASAAPADSLRYLLEKDGRGAGWFSVSRHVDASGNQVYRGTGEKPGSYKLRRCEIVTTPAWVPLHLNVKISAGGQTIEIETEFRDGKAVSEGKAAGSRIPFPEAKIEGQCFVLPNSSPPALALLSDFLAKHDAATYKANLKAFAPPLVVDLEVTGLGTRTVPAGGTSAQVRAFELKLHVPRQRGQQTGRTISLILHQYPDGRFHGFENADDQTRAYPLPADATIEGIAAAFPEKTLKFASGADSLAGSLMLPAPDPARPGPRGALVFVSGSGPSDRDETVGGFAVFRALAEKLAAAGYASLRYDDRGVEDSGGDYGQVTMDILARDAVAAALALRARPEIDPARVGVLGHSEGAILAAQIAALLAQQSGQPPWCVVMMAGSPHAGRDIILQQQEHGLQAGGFSPEQVEHKRALQRQVFACVDGRADWASVLAMADTTETQALEMQRGFIEGPWFKSFLDYAAAGWLKQLKAPVLVLHGELDTQLPPAHGAALRDSLKAAGHERVSYVPARGVNHLFQVAKTGEADEYAELKPEFAPGVAERIAAFLGMCERLK